MFLFLMSFVLFSISFDAFAGNNTPPTPRKKPVNPSAPRVNRIGKRVRSENLFDVPLAKKRLFSKDDEVSPAQNSQGKFDDMSDEAVIKFFKRGLSLCSISADMAEPNLYSTTRQSTPEPSNDEFAHILINSRQSNGCGQSAFSNFRS